MLRQFLPGPGELLTRSQAGQPVVVSCPGVDLVEQVSVLLSIDVVRVVIRVSLLASWTWGWREEDGRQSPLNITIRKILKVGMLKMNFTLIGPLVSSIVCGKSGA